MMTEPHIVEKASICSNAWNEGQTKIFSLFCGNTDEVFEWGLKNSEALRYAGKILYSRLIREKAVEPIESINQADKLIIWNKAIEFSKDTRERIKISHCIYLRNIING